MYSKDHFAKQFRALGTDELVERLARRDLADEARAALADVLRERGHAGDELDGLVHQARKDEFLKSGVDNRCDACGKGVVFAFSGEGQRFCNIDCFHASRLQRAAVDVTDVEAMAHAYALKAGPCPVCRSRGQGPDIHTSEHVTGLGVTTLSSTETFLACRPCANRKNAWAALSCLCFGWWSFRGVLITPFSTLDNLWSIASRRESHEPSAVLVEWARIALAEAFLRETGGGRYGLRP